MKISVQTFPLSLEYGDEATIRALALVGFDGIDFGFTQVTSRVHLSLPYSEFAEYYKNLAKTAKECGIVVNQAHSPISDYKPDEKYEEMLIEEQKRAIEAAAMLGASYIVIHPRIPVQCKYSACRSDAREANLRYYSALRPTLSRFGIKAAIENVFTFDSEKKVICPAVCSDAKELADYVDMCGRDLFTACFDTGHARLVGGSPANEMIHTLGDRIAVLHINDNNGIGDLHTAPFDEKGNKWEDIMKALKNVNYNGMFNFETFGFIKKFPKELWLDAEAYLLKIGRYLVSTL